MIDCLYFYTLSQDIVCIVKKIRHILLYSMHIDMKCNGVISNSIFCVIHKSFCSILHCFLVFSILVIHVMWTEVLCDGNCFVSEMSGLYVFTVLVLHRSSFTVYKYSHILVYICIHIQTFTNTLEK